MLVMKLRKVNLESMLPAVSPFGILQGGLRGFAGCPVIVILSSSLFALILVEQCTALCFADQGADLCGSIILLYCSRRIIF